jgi:ribosome-associated translation inhibitor RaiA
MDLKETVETELRAKFKNPMDAMGIVWTIFVTPYEAIEFVLDHLDETQLERLRKRIAKHGH